MPSNDNIMIKSYKYKMRASYLNQALHFNDKYKNLGFRYYGKILSKTTSQELWANPLQYGMIGKIEELLTYILEQVKMIKKTYSIAHSKDSTNIN